MKIKIIEPYHLDKRYDTRSLTPGIGPVIIGTLLEQAGHDVVVISEYISRLDLDEIKDADLVGISITTYNANRGFEIAKHLKQPIVFGGFHASLMPEECLAYGDYVIRGDGLSILSLTDYLEDKKNNPINEIPNLAYKQHDKTIFNELKTSVINIVPDYHLVKEYFKFGLKKYLRIPLLVNGSRGCPYDCSFCAIKAVYPDLKIKDKTIIIEDIKAQIKERSFWARFFPRMVWITDDNFFANKLWAKEVLIEIAKIRTRYKFVIQARPDLANDKEMLSLMEKAGIRVVFLGIESLNENSLRNFNKETSINDIIFAVKRFQDHGMIVHGLFVFGDDEFKKGDSQKVAAFTRKYDLSGVLIQPLTPYPGTALFQRLKKEDRIIHENWSYYNGNVVFKPKNLTAGELQKEVYDCYRRVFSLSRVIRFFLFGPKGLKLAGLGEAWLRHLEWRRRKRYIKEKLS